MKNKIMLWGVLLVATLAAGCAPLPVLNVDHEQVARYDRKPLSLADMQRVIQLAAAKEEWTTEEPSPGHIVATRQNENEWKIVVDILYTATDFSIHYKDSRGLYYNPMTGKLAKHGRGVMNDLHDRITDEVQNIEPAN